MAKPTLALYWAASCGGCEIAVLDLQEKILDVAQAFDIVFWPAAMDFKYADIRSREDKSIDLCLFNGSIRNSENAEMAHLLRAKSKTLVAFGSCSMEGGIPGPGEPHDESRHHELRVPRLPLNGTDERRRLSTDAYRLCPKGRSRFQSCGKR